MTHTYHISGMTCADCEQTVKSKLLLIPDVTAVSVSRKDENAVITMETHVSLQTLQAALGGNASKYRITAVEHNEFAEQSKSWLKTYLPVLLIFAYITVLSGLVQLVKQQFDYMEWMRHFMAGFFIAFSFFKFLDLRGFAESYSTYDVIAKRFPQWAYVYALLELSLGIAFLTGFEPLLTNWFTFILMTISIMGVLQSVLNKKKIRCACLGTVFNLPMSTITIIEDALMIVMSAGMLLFLKII